MMATVRLTREDARRMRRAERMGEVSCPLDSGAVAYRCAADGAWFNPGRSTLACGRHLPGPINRIRYVLDLIEGRLEGRVLRKR